MCEVRGIGTDLVEIDRMKKLITDSRFMERYFTEEESEYIRSKNKAAAQSVAGIYAAKEAFLKALGTGIVFDLKEIGIIHGAKGNPEYRITGKAAASLGNHHAFLSISHDGGMAVAFCVISGNMEEQQV